MTTDGHVLIIGAGYAGLSCAVSLAERGIPVTVFERRDLPGGRASSVRDSSTNELFDVGSHVFFGCYEHTIRFLATIGTLDRVTFQETPRIPFFDAISGRWDALRMPALPAPLHLLAALLGLKVMSPREKLGSLGLVPLFLGRKGDFAESLDRISAETWLRSLRQPTAAVRLIWEPFCRAAVNLPLERASAALLRVSIERCLLAGARSARVGTATGPAVGLLSPAADDYISSRDGTVQYRRSVRKILLEEDRVGGIETSPPDPNEAEIADECYRDVPAEGRRTQNGAPLSPVATREIRAGSPAAAGETVQASRVVCAGPNLAAARLLRRSGIAGAWVGNLETLSRSAILCVHLGFDRPVLGAPFISLVGTEFEWAFSRKGDTTSEHGDGVWVSMLMSAADRHLRTPATELVALARRELAMIAPDASTGELLRSRVVRSPFATPALTTGTGSLRPGPRTPVHGLYLAGDYTATGLPATVESACASGFAAAEEILADI